MSALNDRLVKQLLRIRDRKLELEVKHQELENKLKQEKDLRQELVVEREKFGKLKSLQETLEKMNLESDAKYTALQEEDNLQKKNLSEELKKNIAEADELSRDLVQREQRAESRKVLLLQQKEIYNQHSNSGKEKFEALVGRRDIEMQTLAEKHEENIRRAPELQKQLEAETEELRVAKAAQEEIQAKVDEFLSRFSVIQGQLNAAKKLYESASLEKDRNTRTLKALSSDLEMIRRRAANSKAERDKELAKVSALAEKVETVRTQIVTFENITRMLTLPDQDGGGGAQTEVVE